MEKELFSSLNLLSLTEYKKIDALFYHGLAIALLKC
jgi:hypothetical protein